MEDVSSLISELLRAANKGDARDSKYVRELLYQAVVEITRMRCVAGIPSVGTRRDRIIGLTNSAAIGILESQVSASLLVAADMLKDLKIVVSEGVAISVKETAL